MPPTHLTRARAAHIAAAWAGFLLAGCAPTSVPVLLEAPAALPTERDVRWEKYGAYCLVDELFVETSFETAVVKTPVNTFLINKKIRILTPQGARFGTVEVPVYGTMVRSFKLEHLDSAGHPVKVEPGPIKTEWLKSGKIIFPNVTAGSVLSIRIESGNSQALTTFEHWFSGPLPVAQGRFTFSHLDIYGYDTKAYGPVRNGHTRRVKGSEDLQYKAWEIKDAYPRSDVDFQDDVDATEPRVALVIRRFHSQDIFESWEEISDDYEKYALKTSFFQSTKKLRALVDSLSRDKATPLEKAQASFAWIQKNVSYKSSALNAINPDKVIASGQGNLWEMAVVLKEMFGHLGLTTDVLITRPRSMGGFDPAFISPSQLAVPLVSVKIGKQSYLAFPWSDGAALGEYPLDYLGLQSLSLSDRNPSSLPDFSGEATFTRTEYRIDPADEDAPVEMTLDLGGYLAFGLRNSLTDARKQDVAEAFQRLLTRLGTSNALERNEVEGLESPGKPMKVKLAFRNPNQAVRRKGETLMRLSHLYHEFFSSYDTTRSSGFKTNLDMDHIEIVRVPKSPDRTLVPNFPCEDLQNSLFQLTCAVEETPVDYVHRRTVRVNRKRLTAEEMRVLAPDIRALNRIREASLIWRAAEPVKTPSANSGKKARR